MFLTARFAKFYAKFANWQIFLCATWWFSVKLSATNSYDTEFHKAKKKIHRVKWQKNNLFFLT